MIFEKVEYKGFYLISIIVLDLLVLLINSYYIQLIKLFIIHGLAISLSLYEMKHHKKRFFIENWEIYASIFIFAYLFSALLFKEDFTKNLVFDINYLVIVFFMYFKTNEYEKRKDFLECLYKIYILITFILSTVSIIMFLTGHGKFLGNTTRFYGIYSHVNYCGMCCWISINLTLYLYSIGKINKGNSLINILLQFILLILSDSRTSMICTMICFMPLIVKLRKKEKAIFISLFCLVIVIGIFFSMKTGRDYISVFQSLKNGEPLFSIVNKIGSNCLNLWANSIKKIMDRPLLGYGISSNNKALTLYLDYSNSHNIVLNILLYTGLIGLFTFLTFVRDVSKEIIRNIKNINIYLLMFLCGCLIFSLLDCAVLYEYYNTTILFWYILGYLYFSVRNVYEQ